jgi:ribosomal protein L37AE/L43A
MAMNTCPCCGDALLRHARKGRVYWFCTHCWQELPDEAIAPSVPQSPTVLTPNNKAKLSSIA